MSIKDRLAKKTEGLLVPGKSMMGTTGAQMPLKTGPGQMLMVNSLMKETNEKVSLLQDRLKEFEGSAPVRLIEAEKILASKWANRVDENFESTEFAILKSEIASAQGNIQPIKVRPLKGNSERYEVVFGHRRHRACLELGLPVLAMIEEVSDRELFKEMDRENRSRQDLSPWEQGMMYRRALDEGLFLSLGELAQELAVDKGNISKALRLAELPADVVAAFPSPTDLQYRWSKLLNDAIQRDPEGVLVRARELRLPGRARPAPKQVLESLLGVTAPVSVNTPVVVNGKNLADVLIDGDRVVVKFARGALDAEKTERLRKMLVDLLDK
jgi:ParB family chromosome partitioning protein